jgi:NADH dehydrogenase FAD-containing subunit
VKTRITEVEVETEEIVVMRVRATCVAWCAGCSAEVVMARPEAAAARAGLRVREIYRLVEAGSVHFRELSDGTVFVCLESVPCL